MKINTPINDEKVMLYNLFTFIHCCEYNLKDSITLESIPEMLKDFRNLNGNQFVTKYFKQ